MDNENAIVLIGAGKLGTGLLGELFYSHGYHLVFIDRYKPRVEELRNQGYYTVKMVYRDERKSEKRRIEGYEAYCMVDELDKCINRLTDIDLVSVQIYPDGLEEAAEMLAEAIKNRVRIGKKTPLNIMFNVNFVFPARRFRNAIEKHLNEQEKAFVEESVGFVECLPRRGVYPPTPDMIAEDPLMVTADVIEDQLPAGTDFKGSLPNTPALRFIEKAGGFLVQKIFISNMSHCILNAAGSVLNDAKFCKESCADTYIRSLVDAARMEACDAVATEYSFSDEEMADISITPWQSLANPDSGDTVQRGAGDPIRKLARDDRLTGPGLLSLKHQKMPFNISRGTAFEFLYFDENDEGANEIQSFILSNGIEAAVEKYCQLNLLDPVDKIWHQLVVKQYNDIQALKKRTFL